MYAYYFCQITRIMYTYYFYFYQITCIMYTYYTYIISDVSRSAK